MAALWRHRGRTCETQGLEEAVISIVGGAHCLRRVERRIVVLIVLKSWGGIEGMSGRTRRHMGERSSRSCARGARCRRFSKASRDGKGELESNRVSNKLERQRVWTGESESVGLVEQDGCRQS